MKRVLASVAFFLLWSPALADCLPPLEGLLELRGEVASCRSVKAPRPSREPHLRVSIPSPTVTILGCEEGKCAALADYQHYAALLEDQDLFFIPASSGISCSTVQSQDILVAHVPYQCCDTIPHRGVCALGGPIVERIADDS